MRRLLTRRQYEVLKLVVDYLREHGYPPTVREIGRALRITSASTVYDHLSRLEKKGFIRLRARRPRGIDVVLCEAIPVPAGQDASGLPGSGECFLVRTWEGPPADRIVVRRVL